MSVIRGTADNGRIVYVEMPGYAGPAGFRQQDGWAEIAFFGAVEPSGEPITVDGRAAKVLRALPSDNPGVMTALAVAYA